MQSQGDSQQAETRGNDGADKVEKHSAGEFPLAQGGWSFGSIQDFNWLEETHPHYEWQSVYSKLNDSNVDLI